MTAGPAPADLAAQVRAVIQNTTSIAVLDDFIRQFDSTPHGSMARARRDELRGSQIASVAPSIQAPSPAGGLPKNDREAVRDYKLAAGQGFAHAQASLGFFYREGLGGLTKNELEAARLYKLAAGQGDAHAKSALRRLGLR